MLLDQAGPLVCDIEHVSAQAAGHRRHTHSLTMRKKSTMPGVHSVPSSFWLGAVFRSACHTRVHEMQRCHSVQVPISIV